MEEKNQDFSEVALAVKPQTETEEAEKKELTEEEQKALEIQQLKNASKFKSNKNFGVEYRKTRRKKNQQQKKSRKINRKK